MNIKNIVITSAAIAAMMVPACAVHVDYDPMTTGTSESYAVDAVTGATPQGKCMTSEDGLYHFDGCNAHRYRCTDEEWQMILNRSDSDIDVENTNLFYDEEHNLLLEFDIDNGFLDIFKNTNAGFFSDLWSKTKTNISVPVNMIRLPDSVIPTTSMYNLEATNVSMTDLIPENSSDTTYTVKQVSVTYDVDAGTVIEINRTNAGMVYLNADGEVCVHYQRGESKQAGVNMYGMCVKVNNGDKVSTGSLKYFTCDVDDEYADINLGTKYAEQFKDGSLIVAVAWQNNGTDGTEYICEFLYGNYSI